MATLHLADIEHGGPYLDLGNRADAHHAMGGWRADWGPRGVDNERDYAAIGKDARLWFHLDRVAPITLRLSARAVGTRALVAYLNGQRVGQFDFAGEGFETLTLPVRGRAAKAGENVLRLRSPRVRRRGGTAVSVELDAIHVQVGSTAARPAGGGSPPAFRSLLRPVRAGGEERAAVVLPAGAKLRFYVDVPPEAALEMGLLGVGGSAGAGLSAQAEGGERVQLFRGEVGDGLRPQRLSLGRFAGQVVRLGIANAGPGRLAIAAPRVSVPASAGPVPPARAKSVVLLLIDTLRADKLRVYNPRSRVQTPTLTSFAEDAVVFERAQSPENWTKPSVASILTSLAPMTHQTKEGSSRLSQRALMLSEVYKEAGFSTASFIANGYVSDRFGFDQGWDYYTNYIRESKRTEAEAVFEEALGWIERQQRRGSDQRFFAYIQTIDPHVPYDPPDEYLRLYDARPYRGRVRPRNTGNSLGEAKQHKGYYTQRDIERLEALHDGEISYHDHYLSRFFERLAALSLERDVIFAVTSDHGEEFKEHGSFGHGHSVFQELLHVPLMVRWPAGLSARRVPWTVSTMDLAPTLLEATGVAIPEAFEGRSLLPDARGARRAGPAVAFSEKLGDRRVATAAGYKLIVRRNLSWAFFNLRQDPGERVQIDDGARHPIALRYLRGLLGQYLGAADRRHWLTSASRSAHRTGTRRGSARGASARGEGRGRPRGQALPAQDAQMDSVVCRQLKALGYHPDECP